jgi:hypothetical protein
MQDDQNGQKTMVLPSADKTRLTRVILSKKISSKRSCLAADGNTIMNLPWYPRKIIHFSLVLSPSRPKISMPASRPQVFDTPFHLIHKHICLIPVSIATILKPFAICS